MRHGGNTLVIQALDEGPDVGTPCPGRVPGLPEPLDALRTLSMRAGVIGSNLG
jgi:hypothetical protein